MPYRLDRPDRPKGFTITPQVNVEDRRREMIVRGISLDLLSSLEL